MLFTTAVPVIQVPVGRATLGRIINVIGEPIDEKGDLSKNFFYHLFFHCSQHMRILEDIILPTGTK